MQRASFPRQDAVRPDRTPLSSAGTPPFRTTPQHEGGSPWPSRALSGEARLLMPRGGPHPRASPHPRLPPIHSFQISMLSFVARVLVHTLIQETSTVPYTVYLASRFRFCRRNTTGCSRSHLACKLPALSCCLVWVDASQFHIMLPMLALCYNNFFDLLKATGCWCAFNIPSCRGVTEPATVVTFETHSSEKLALKGAAEVC